ncbi:glycosyltransferase involved in cell wall biosynthesis [Catalinimonas alkaloidigena]|uniref:glycosyltransferase family 4 protein n=1 Tax=Catalinimonas alkaloidigena TaxID=1075417 RepID=UPI002405161A|nr:glycosyltransferase family 4 protein [Catalinimonas alkaloidigena]MDF9801082.1 glycosyltransferase involved in cell wall biosynthesis [Catalinimonas alkaloidigena]
MQKLKIAIIHEWFVDHSGSEKVLEHILNVFPHADLFSVVEFLPNELKYFIQNKPVKTTFIQKLPFAKKRYRNYLPLMPLAIEQLNVSAYDVVISNSHAVSKGVITNSNQLHICYCHSPMRYAWDLYHQYLKESGLDKGVKGFLAKLFLHYLRQWDLSTIHRIDHFIANSNYIAARINKVYKRKAKVIYPPVHVEKFELHTAKEDFFLTASRFVPYKKIDVIVEAFSRIPEERLVVIGDGPDNKKIREKASGCANITFLGFQDQKTLISHMQRAKAFVFAADEDFGIIPVEAQACGTPVIAFGKGGSLETVKDGVTGLFFYQQSTNAIIEALKKFKEDHHQFDPLLIREHAESFSVLRFQQEIKDFIISKLADYQQNEAYHI